MSQVPVTLLRRRRHAKTFIAFVGLFALLAAVISSTAASGAPPERSSAPEACAAAEALYRSGRFAAAEKAYADALGKADSLRCARAGLAKLDRSEKECATAAALQTAGRDDEARSAYEEVLKTAPESRCAQEGLQELSTSVFDDPGSSAQTVLSWLGLIALLVGGVAIAVALLLMAITRIPGLRELWPASRIRALRVSIEAFDDSAVSAHHGVALAALVRSKIESFGDESSNLQMIDSQAAIEETVWNKFGAINDQAKAVSAVLSTIGALYPRRQLQATGALQAEGKSGPAISVSLRQGQALSGAATLWAEEFGLSAEEGDAASVERVQRLAVPAAAWISHTTATAAGNTPGGSKDPVSWALFKTGIEWEADGDTEKAIDLYRRAIEIDAKNWGAQANLGALEGERRNYKAATAHLRSALEVLEA